jgi:hypothetical protein
MAAHPTADRPTIATPGLRAAAGLAATTLALVAGGPSQASEVGRMLKSLLRKVVRCVLARKAAWAGLVLLGGVGGSPARHHFNTFHFLL